MGQIKIAAELSKVLRIRKPISKLVLKVLLILRESKRIMISRVVRGKTKVVETRSHHLKGSQVEVLKTSVELHKIRRIMDQVKSATGLGKVLWIRKPISKLVLKGLLIPEEANR